MNWKTKAGKQHEAIKGANKIRTTLVKKYGVGFRSDDAIAQHFNKFKELDSKYLMKIYKGLI